MMRFHSCGSGLCCNLKFNAHSLQESNYPVEYQGHFSNLMLTKQEILDRIKALAKLIHEDYADVRPAMICILKGASPVSSSEMLMNPLDVN